MKTVLFYPRIENSFRSSYAPLGILSIATYLNANGHNAVIRDRFFESDSIGKVLKEHSPDVIGISVISHTFLDDAILISKAAKAMGIPVIWGGSFATTIDKVILDSGFVDFVSRNEGELTWLEIADNFDSGKDFFDIDGLSYMKDGQYIRNPDRDFVDLESLPELDWSLVDPKRYFQKTYGFNRMISMYFSKGCPGRCTYCYNPGFHHSTRRCRNPEAVFNEMKTLVEQYGADGFDFTDDVLFSCRQDAVDFCNELAERNMNICWSGYLRVGILNSLEDFQMLYKSGCRSLIFGIESGSPRILKSVNKHVALDKVKSNIEFCSKAGIVPVSMFIIGLPDEDEEDIKMSLELARSLDGAAVVYNFFTPIPGSELYNKLVASGKLTHLTDIYEYAKIQDLETLFDNYTKVPTKELLIIRKYARLRGIVTPTDNSAGEQLGKVIMSAVKSWCGRGILHFFRGALYTVSNIVTLFTIFFHPKIRKKYSLYFLK